MRSNGLITLKEPNSYISERYKMLRTNLNAKDFQDKKTLLITSASQDEGKATAVCNLAVTIAQTGKKVLLIEGDLRHPKIHDLLNVSQESGLTEVLENKKTLSDMIKESPSCKGLYILTSGELTHSPSELLASDQFANLIEEAKSKYDFIIVDAPPVNLYTDAAVLSRLMDGVLLVVVSNKTKKDAIVSAKKALEKVDANILGVAMLKQTRK